MTAPEWIDHDEITRRVSHDRARRLLGQALTDGFDPTGEPPRTAADAADGHLLFMPSTVGAATGIKLLSVSPDNPARGFPRIQGWYILMDSDTLTPTVLLDGTALTTIRTPAVSMLGVEYLCPEQVDQVLFIGSGPQTVAHAEALLALRRPARAVLSARNAERAAATAARITELGIPCEVVEAADLPSAARASQLIICATSTAEPVLESDWVADGTCIVAIGSHEPDRRELTGELMSRSLVVVEDVDTALREAGDVVRAIDEGNLDRASLRTLREVVLGEITAPVDRPTVVKTVGMGWQDLVIAAGAADPR